jgi:hypothetical protein
VAEWGLLGPVTGAAGGAVDQLVSSEAKRLHIAWSSDPRRSPKTSQAKVTLSAGSMAPWPMLSPEGRGSHPRVLGPRLRMPEPGDQRAHHKTRRTASRYLITRRGTRRRPKMPRSAGNDPADVGLFHVEASAAVRCGRSRIRPRGPAGWW